MKTSKFFFSTLIAAAAMTATAYAEQPTIAWNVADGHAYKWDSTNNKWITGSWSNTTGFSWTETTADAVSRADSKGWIAYFDGVNQTFSPSIAGDLDSSDGGGIVVSGTGNTVNAFLGRWAGSIQVDATNILNTSWSAQLKDGAIVANGVVNITSGNLDLDGAGERNWWVGSDGAINFLTPGSLSLSNGTVRLSGEVDNAKEKASLDGLLNRTLGIVVESKKLLSFENGLGSGLELLSVGDIGAVSGASLNSVASVDELVEENSYFAEKSSSGVTVYYTVEGQIVRESLTWAGASEDSTWVEKGTAWESSTGVATSFLSGDDVYFNSSGAVVSVEGVVCPQSMSISAKTTFSGENWRISAGSVNLFADVVLDGTLGIIVAEELDVSQDVSILGDGTIEVANKGLRISEGAALNLGKGVVLNLGTQANGTLEANVIGEGTIVWANVWSLGHGTEILLNERFTGTLNLGGKISGSSLELGGTSKIVSNTERGLWIWGGSGFGSSVLDIDIIKGTENLFSVAVTAQTLNISGGKTTFGYGVTVDALNILGGEATFNSFASVSGNAVLKDAKLILANGGKEGAFRGALTVASGGILTLSAGDATGWGGDEKSLHTLTISEGGLLNVNADQTFAGMAVTLSGGTIAGESTIDLFAANQSGTLSTITALGGASDVVVSTITTGLYLRQDDSVVLVEERGRLDISGVIGNTRPGNSAGGNNALIKQGLGVLTLSGDNTYSGGTTISAGTVVAAHANALGTGAVTLAGGDLDIRADVTLNELNGTGAKALESDIVNKGKDEYTLRVQKGDTDGGIVGLTEHDDGPPSYTLSLVKFGDADDKLSLRNYLAVKNLTIEGGTLSWSQKDFDGKDNWGSIEKDLLVKSEAQFELVLSDSSKKGYALSVGGDVNLASRAKIVVDLSGVKAGGEEIVLNIIAANAINFGWTETSEALIAADGYSVEDFVSITGDEHLAAYVNQMWSYSNGALSLTLAIPEPSMFGLLAGLGALALAGTRRRRK